MYRWFTRGRWAVTVLAVLIIGGTIAVSSQVQQASARDDLLYLRIANSNLELVTQARLDEAFGQRSLAFTSGDDENLVEHADRLRELSDLAEPGLTEWRERLDEAVAFADGRELRSVALALDTLESATTGPVWDAQRAAADRVLWSVLATGGLLALLMFVELRRPEDEPVTGR